MLGGIGDLLAADVREWCECVFLRLGGTYDFEDADTASEQRICDKRTVAPPGQCLGAQERRWQFGGECDPAIERCCEFWRLHVVRKAAEAFIAPTEVHRIGTGVAQAPEVLQVSVSNVRGAKGGGERVRIKLRVAAGLRDGADIEDLRYAVSAKKFHEFADWTRGMANGEDSERLSGARGLGSRLLGCSRLHTPFTKKQFHDSAGIESPRIPLLRRKRAGDNGTPRHRRGGVWRKSARCSGITEE